MTSGKPGLRLAVLGAVLIAAAVAGWWLQTTSQPEPVRSQKRPAADEPALGPSLVGGPTRAVGEEGTQRPVQGDPAPQPASASGPEAGTVPVVLRFTGPGNPPTICELQVALDEDYERVSTVHFVDGKNTGFLPRASRYGVVGVVLDGWSSNQWYFKPFLPGPDGSVEIPIELPHRGVLQVVDAATGQPLPAAVAFRVQRREDIMDAAPAPGPDRGEVQPLTADDGGRIRLPPSSRQVVWWVVAPDHAWARVSPAATDPLVRVPLSPGGELRVEVVGWSDLDEPEVQACLVRDGQPDKLTSIVLLATAQPGTLVADGLPPGNWHVAVGRADGLWLEQEWATAQAEVEPGRVAVVRLTPPRVPPRARTTLIGTLSVPTAWGIDDQRVSLIGQGEENGQDWPDAELTATGRPGEWRFAAKDLVVGLYEVTVYPIGWCILVQVTEKVGPVRLDVPPPVPLKARVLDATTNEPIAAAKVTLWHDVQPRASVPAFAEGEARAHGSGGDWFVADSAPGSFGIRAYAARVRLVAGAAGYAEEERILELKPGTTPAPVEFRLNTVGGVRVRLVRGGSVATEIRGSARVSVVAEGQQDEAGWHSIEGELSDGVATLESVKPGTYEVSCELTTGAKLASQTVEVVRGKVTTVDFEVPPR